MTELEETQEVGSSEPKEKGNRECPTSYTGKHSREELYGYEEEKRVQKMSFKYNRDEKKRRQEKKREEDTQSPNGCIRVEMCDFHERENAKKHNTDKYEIIYSESSRPVYRRGQVFHMSIRFKDRQFDPDHDKVRLVFNFGPNPSVPKQTRIYLPLTSSEKRYDEEKINKWEANISKVDDKCMDVEVFIPADAPVGVWRCWIETCPEGFPYYRRDGSPYRARSSSPFRRSRTPNRRNRNQEDSNQHRSGSNHQNDWEPYYGKEKGYPCREGYHGYYEERRRSQSPYKRSYSEDSVLYRRSDSEMHRKRSPFSRRNSRDQQYDGGLKRNRSSERRDRSQGYENESYRRSHSGGIRHGSAYPSNRSYEIQRNRSHDRRDKRVRIGGSLDSGYGRRFGRSNEFGRRVTSPHDRKERRNMNSFTRDGSGSRYDSDRENRDGSSRRDRRREEGCNRFNDYIRCHSRGRRDDSRGKREDSRERRDDSRGRRDDSRGKRDDSRERRDNSRGRRDDSRGKRDDSRERRDESRNKKNDSRNRRDYSSNRRDDSMNRRDYSRYFRENNWNNRDDSSNRRNGLMDRRDYFGNRRDNSKGRRNDSRNRKDRPMNRRNDYEYRLDGSPYKMETYSGQRDQSPYRKDCYRNERDHSPYRICSYRDEEYGTPSRKTLCRDERDLSSFRDHRQYSSERRGNVKSCSDAAHFRSSSSLDRREYSPSNRSESAQRRNESRRRNANESSPSRRDGCRDDSLSRMDNDMDGSHYRRNNYRDESTGRRNDYRNASPSRRYNYMDSCRSRKEDCRDGSRSRSNYYRDDSLSRKDDYKHNYRVDRNSRRENYRVGSLFRKDYYRDSSHCRRNSYKGDSPSRDYDYRNNSPYTRHCYRDGSFDIYGERFRHQSSSPFRNGRSQERRRDSPFRYGCSQERRPNSPLRYGRSQERRRDSPHQYENSQFGDNIGPGGSYRGDGNYEYIENNSSSENFRHRSSSPYQRQGPGLEYRMRRWRSYSPYGQYDTKMDQYSNENRRNDPYRSRYSRNNRMSRQSSGNRTPYRRSYSQYSKDRSYFNRTFDNADNQTNYRKLSRSRSPCRDNRGYKDFSPFRQGRSRDSSPFRCGRTAFRRGGSPYKRYQSAPYSLNGSPTRRNYSPFRRNTDPRDFNKRRSHSTERMDESFDISRRYRDSRGDMGRCTRDDIERYSRDDMERYKRGDMDRYTRDRINRYRRDDIQGYSRDDMERYKREDMGRYKKDDAERYGQDDVDKFRRDDMDRYRSDGFDGYKGCDMDRNRDYDMERHRRDDMDKYRRDDINRYRRDSMDRFRRDDVDRKRDYDMERYKGDDLVRNRKDGFYNNFKCRDRFNDEVEGYDSDKDYDNRRSDDWSRNRTFNHSEDHYYSDRDDERSFRRYDNKRSMSRERYNRRKGSRDNRDDGFRDEEYSFRKSDRSNDWYDQRYQQSKNRKEDDFDDDRHGYWSDSRREDYWRCKQDRYSSYDNDFNGEVFKCNQDIFILFNPWSKDDATYMEDEVCRREYVLNDIGKIWIGTHRSNRGRRWVFGQFDDVVLPAVMYLMEEARLSGTDRANPIQMVRGITEMVNNRDHDGGDSSKGRKNSHGNCLMIGRWDGEYDDGLSPYSWTGSVRILEQYMETGKPVKYGQCWVFAAVTTTICRALGIPCRPVTNFISAHDTSNTMSVDKYFSCNGDEIERAPEGDSWDSIWTFHSWNDVWMDRPDLPPGCGGWQAIDSTYQEECDGRYKCGPASLDCIRRGDIGFNYDTRYIFSEVNTEINHWQQDDNSDWGFTRIRPGRYHAGCKILTKAPDFDDNEYDEDCMNIIDEYKPRDSHQEHEKLLKAFRGSEPGRKKPNRFYKDHEDVMFQLRELPRVSLGQPLLVEMRIKNQSGETRSIEAMLCCHSMYYNGVKNERVMQDNASFVLPPNEHDTFILEIKPEDYEDKMVDMWMMKIYAIANVKETGQVFGEEDDFCFEKPRLQIQTQGPQDVGEDLEAAFSFVNPLDITLTNCRFTFEGPGLQSSRTVKCRDVKPGETVNHVERFVPKQPGDTNIVAAFTSHQLNDVYGSIKVTVKG